MHARTGRARLTERRHVLRESRCEGRFTLRTQQLHKLLPMHATNRVWLQEPSMHAGEHPCNQSMPLLRHPIRSTQVTKCSLDLPPNV